MDLANITNIYGIEPISKYILAGIILGENTCLIGSPGTGKTSLVRAISEAMGYSPEEFGAYSTPTLNFEDLIGFIVPVQDDGQTFLTYQQIHGVDSTGKVIHSDRNPLIWPKRLVLFDELNRCSPNIQNQLLCLIRDKSCLDMPIQNLEVVFGAMNELHEKGTKPLDSALADRFMFFVTMPKYNKLSENDKMSILKNRTYQDSTSIERTGKLEQNQVLIDYVASCRELVRDMFYDEKDKYGIYNFVMTFIDTYHQKIGNAKASDYKIDGRRGGMLARGMMAVAAQYIYENDFESFKKMRVLEQTVLFSLPTAATFPEGLNEEHVKTAVKIASVQLTDSNNPLSKYYKINGDPIVLLRDMFTDEIVFSSPTLSSQGLEYIINMIEQNFEGVERKQKLATISISLPLFEQKIDKKTLSRLVEMIKNLNPAPALTLQSGENAKYALELSKIAQSESGSYVIPDRSLWRQTNHIGKIMEAHQLPDTVDDKIKIANAVRDLKQSILKTKEH